VVQIGMARDDEKSCHGNVLAVFDCVDREIAALIIDD
jgi:hypothetical protein